MRDIIAASNNAKEIIIYGAGTISNIMFLYLKQEKLLGKLKCFAVTCMENNPHQKYGFPVVEAKEIAGWERGSLILVAAQEVVQREICDYLDKLNLHNYLCVEQNTLLDSFYSELYREPVKKNKIIFSNMKSLGYGCNPKYIAEKLIEMDKKKNLDMVWVVSSPQYNFPPEIRTVEFGSYEYYRELATAHIWVDNTRKNFDTRKREGQYYLQVWHGAAPIKKVEKDVESSLPAVYIVNAKRDSQMADVFISGSRFYTKLYKESFWYNGKIMKVGLPRQDIFWHMEGVREKVFKYYNIDKAFSLVLYAPTFRKNFTNEYYNLDFKAVVKSLEKRFDKKFVVAVSKHPDNRYMEYNFKDKDYIAVENYEDFEELLAAADVLITDYSGCMYDFSYTKRPVFLYQADFELYKKDRDFYIPMEKLPYIKAHSNAELIDEILNFNEDSYLESLNEFMATMGNYDNGHASGKVAEHILDIMDLGD
jgi:CDP-glycerol glycerophosphotransferase